MFLLLDSHTASQGAPMSDAPGAGFGINGAREAGSGAGGRRAGSGGGGPIPNGRKRTAADGPPSNNPGLLEAP